MKKIITISLVALFLAAVTTTAMAGGVAVTKPVTVSATIAVGTNDLQVKNKAGTVLNNTTSPFTIPAFPAATSTTYRFSTGINSGTYTAPGQLEVNFFPAAPYEIRIYTDHSVPAGDPAIGYLLSGTKQLPLKLWCQNFGAPAASTANGPDPMRPYFWKGLDLSIPPDGDKVDTVPAGETRAESTYGDLNGDGDALDTITSTGPGGGYVSPIQYALGEEPCWLWMLEKGTIQEGFGAITGKTYKKEDTRRRLSYNYPTDADLGSPFNVFLAVDLRGIADGTYTGDVTFQMYTY